MGLEYTKIKSFLYDCLAETAVSFGIFPETEGGIAPLNQKNLRLRNGFRNFTTSPAADSQGVLTGEVQVEILYEPGSSGEVVSDCLQDRIIALFSPGNGELQNETLRILTHSVKSLEPRNEGKYCRTGVSVKISVWEKYAG